MKDYNYTLVDYGISGEVPEAVEWFRRETEEEIRRKMWLQAEPVRFKWLVKAGRAVFKVGKWAVKNAEALSYLCFVALSIVGFVVLFVNLVERLGG